MKSVYKFRESGALFLLTMIVLWGITIPIIVVLILSKKYEDIYYWISWAIFLIITPLGSLIAYARMMSLVCIDEIGVSKQLFSKTNKQFLPWSKIMDCQFVTRPNGYTFLVVSNQKIEKNSFSECLKDKEHCICFTYNEKALEIIKKKIKTEV